MIFFSQRLQIEDMFDEWRKEKGISNFPSAVIAFLQIKGWLNEEQISKDLKMEEQK